MIKIRNPLETGGNQRVSDLLTRGVNRRNLKAIKAARPAMTIQSYTKLIVGRKPIDFYYGALVSPKHCEHDPQGGCPSEKPDLSDHSLKRSPEKDKQRKWWCKVPVWRERYHGLIRSDTGKLEQHCAVVPPNALFVLW